MEERLQKILAQAGIASRRAAEKYITEGRVRVNGEVVNELGAKADPENDTIEVDGYGVLEREPLVYLALHKPIHVVTTVSDPEKRQTVIDVIAMSRAAGRKSFEGNMPRIFPVGRLDFDAEGLLVLTNDGALSNDLLHPRYHVPKTYVVKVKGRPDPRQLDRLRRGVRLREEDGGMSRPTAPAEVNVVRESPANTWLEVVIHEGRHHQVKRMFEAVRSQVIRLIRTAFGGIELGELDVGQWRFLTEGEVELLRAWRAGNASDLLASKPAKRTTDMMFARGSGRGARNAAPRAFRKGSEGYGAPRPRSEERRPRPDDRRPRTDRRPPRSDYGRPTSDEQRPRTDRRPPRADYARPSSDDRRPRSDRRPPRADYGRPTSDDRRPRSDRRPPRADYGRPTSDDRRPRSDRRPPRADYGRPTSDDRRPRTDRRPPRSEHGRPASDERRPRSDDRRPRTDRRPPMGDERRPRRDGRPAGRPAGRPGGRRPPPRRG